MRYIHNHVDSILTTYKGEMPLSNFLKVYFRQYPILGSRDRKIISEILYCYYRCARAIRPEKSSMAEKADLGLLYCESDFVPVKRILPSHLSVMYGNGFGRNRELLLKMGYDLDLNALLPEAILFSEGIRREEWCTSILSKPKIFIRVVKRHLPYVLEQLNAAGIHFERLQEYCLSLPNGTKLESLLSPGHYRIQDASSQATMAYMSMKGTESCWDCCSGAGGKSLLIKELAPAAPLCVSDIRASILANLAERFRLYDLPQPECLQVSVENQEELDDTLGNRRFRHIVADVPCSGSGTWARTPEQLHFFEKNKLEVFSARQKKIAANAVRFLEAGGSFTYITCSVFAAENEEIVDFLLKQDKQLRLKEQKLINGISIGADSMFVAVLEREM